MSWYEGTSTSGSYSDYIYQTPRKRYLEDIKIELTKIAKEVEDDKEKYLPIFDPKELDI